MHSQGHTQTARDGPASVASREPPDTGSILELLKRYYQGQQDLRRGICLLNGGQYDKAFEAFQAAAAANPDSHTLPTLMAACHVGRGKFEAAGSELAKAVERDDTDVTARVRHALSLWRASKSAEAVASLREGLRRHPESTHAPAAREARRKTSQLPDDPEAALLARYALSKAAAPK